MRKFYKTAEAGTAPGGYVVRLDGKTIRTPLQHPLVVPSEEMARAMAEEWAAQGSQIIPATMPMTQLVNTMIDKGKGPDRAEMSRQLCDYAASDLVCYFATHPHDLVEQQEKAWLPLLEWLGNTCAISLGIVRGIRYHNQPAEALKRFSALLDELDPAGFTALQAAAGVTGSVVIALALVRGRISAREAYAAACVDETYQIGKWGADDIAQKRLDGIRAELEIVERFLSLLKASC